MTDAPCPPARPPHVAARDALRAARAALADLPAARARARELRLARLAARVGPLPVWAWLLALSALAVATRLVAFAVQDGMHYPDELFQYLEPAQAHLHGHGWLPWEFVRGARNWILPWHYGALMAALDALGLEGHALLRALWLHNTLLAALIVPLAFRLGAAAARGDLRVGLLSAAAAATFPQLAYFAPHTLAEWHGLLLVTWAYTLWLEQVRWPDLPGPLRRAFLVGLLLGAVFITRFGLAVFLPLPLLDYNLRGRIREFLAALAGLALALALLGLADLAMWGKPFHSVIEYVRFNWIEGGAAHLEAKPSGWYWEAAFVERLGAGLWLALAPMALFAHRHWRLILGWLLPLLLLSRIGIKQERFLLPLWPLFLAAAASGWVATADHAARLWPRLRRWTPAALPAALLAAVVATSLAGTSAWTTRMRAGLYLAQDWVGDQPDATGVLVDGPAHMHGGHTLLHRNIPQLPFAANLLPAPIFSHVILESAPAAERLLATGEFEEVARFEADVRVLRRLTRLVGADPASWPERFERWAGGDGGGAPVPLACPAGTALVGLAVDGPDGRPLAALRPLCGAPGRPDPEAGAWVGRPPARGREGERAPTARCPEGATVVGLHGRAGALIDALGPLCRPAATPSAPPTSGPTRGGPGGSPFSLGCPAGYALAGLVARAGDALDAVGVVCARDRAAANP